MYEVAQSYEYEVTSVLAFFYEDTSGNGINGGTANETTEVIPVYFGEMEKTEDGTGNIDKVVTTKQQSVSLSSGTSYNVLAVANPSAELLKYAMGDSGDTPQTGITLGVLRDYIDLTTSKKAWTEDTSGTNTTFSNFVMSSSEETTGVNLSNATDGVATAEVTVQRMAVRVDYYANSEGYTIGDGTDAMIYDEAYKGATITIQGAALFNVLNSGSYLFKRVTAKDDYTLSDSYPTSLAASDVKYLGPESVTYDGSGYATSGNYVIDPWTTGKNGTAAPSSITAGSVTLAYDTYYSGVASSGVSITAGANTYDQTQPEYWSTLITNGVKDQTSLTDSEGKAWTRVGYALENTTFAPYTSKKYSTGVVFKALFKPNSETLEKSYSNSSSATFFKYNDVLYATLEDLMCAMLGDTFAKAFMTSTTVTSTLSNNSIETWADLATYIKDMSIDPLGYKDYLTGLCTTEGTNDITTFQSITDYLKATFGYSYSSGTFTYDQSSHDTYSELLAKNITTYADGICYYVWWIRHSNDNDDYDNGIMEYSIVRNNVYKLNVSSVYTLGGAIPTEGLYMDVYVKPWCVYPNEEVDL